MTQPDPVIPVFPAGYAPVQADFATWVTDPFSFLTSKVMFRGQLQAAQSLSAGDTLLHLDTIAEDPYSGWSATSTGAQPAWSWLCPAGCSGWYEITMSALTGSQSTASQTGALLYVNGSLYQQASSGWAVNGADGGSCGVVQVPLLAGTDYLQFYIRATTATSAPATAGQDPTAEVAWLST